MIKSIEEIVKNILKSPANSIDTPIGDMVLNNGEMLREIPEFIDAVTEALTEAKAQAVEEERKRILKIIAVPKYEVVNVMEKVIRNKILSDINK